MRLRAYVSLYDVAKLLFLVSLLSGVISLQNSYSNMIFASLSQSSTNEQATPKLANRTAISVSSPEYVVSGTSITVMGKLFDIDVDPPVELSEKELRFSGSGVTQYWRPITTGGFVILDPSDIIEIQSCATCEPDSGRTSGNKFVSLEIGSEINLPNGTRGIKLSLLNVNATHYDIAVTTGNQPQNTTLVTEESQLLNNTRSDLAILFPEGISKVSLTSNNDTSAGSQVGILKLQTFDPAGDPENQTTIDFEDFTAPSETRSPLVLNAGGFASTNVAVDDSPGPFNVNVSFSGDRIIFLHTT